MTNSGRLAFDPGPHLYALDGRPIRSVTQVLEEAGYSNYRDFGEDRQFYLDRGNAVHKMTELDDYDDLEPLEEDNLLYQYWVEWKRFKSENTYEPIWIEKRVFNDTYWYAGTLDRICRVNGKMCVMDIKTASHFPWYSLQNAAYFYSDQVQAEFGKKKLHSMTLALRGKPGYDPLWHKNVRRDYGVFLSGHSRNGWIREKLKGATLCQEK